VGCLGVFLLIRYRRFGDDLLLFEAVASGVEVRGKPVNNKTNNLMR
jgi:hypothetical protein